MVQGAGRLPSGWGLSAITMAGPRDRAFLWLAMAYFLLNFAQGVFPPLLPQVMEGLGLGFAGAGLLGSAFGVARFLTDVPAGLLVERRGAEGVLHAGIACLLVGTLLCAWAPSLAVMLLARVLVGAGSGMTIVVSVLFVMRRGPPAERTRRGNLYEVAVIGATATSAWLGGAVGTWLGWRGGFTLAAAAVGLGWVVVARRVLPAAGPVLVPAASPAPPTGSRRSRRGGTILAIYLAAFTLAATWSGGIATLLPLYGGRGLGLSSEVLGRTLALAYAVEVALLLPVGWAADRLGRLRVLLPAFTIMAIGALAVPRTPSALTFGVAASCLVGGITAWMVPPVLLAERLPGGFRGPAAGLYRLVSDAGYVVAPGTVGWLIAQHGFEGAGLALGGLLLTSAVVAASTLGRWPGRV